MPDVLATARWREPLPLPEPALGELPRRAAALWPDRTALRHGERTLTFGELERATARCAAAVRQAVGTGAVVGAATVLAPVFASLYYGVARSGNTVVTLNPLVRGEALRHVLAASGTRLALLTREMWEKLAPFRDGLPDLATVVVLDCGTQGPPAGTVALEELLAAAPADDGRAERTDPDAVACVHFTSGTTGAPKAVPLTHRNLTVNAAQTAQAQGLDATSVTLNQLPLYHLMHLNSALWAGAAQVLCPDDDAAAAVAAADAYGATHWFSIPVRLARLAADPRLPDLRPRTVRGIFCGGSALPAGPARILSERFGIPVVQGYGLAEASPTVALDLPGRPRPGSCGPVVAGTECRVVGLGTRRVLAPGERGEIQIRGPQLMRGYLGPDGRRDFDEEGWFSTGDVGHLDEDGYLFVADRLGDVFKCDNEIVAPTEVEAVLARHPAVADCVVFGHPDEFSGSVAHALVVLREQGPDGPGSTPERVAEEVNADLAPFQRIQYIDAVPGLPRGPGGKVQRRVLRATALGA
ncbi:class I adenylate-forming enzyme family protein [Streptomyces sp. TG1A-8]|uniref:class I adenylate-forming enzyme family protein n=1 Tax=Streptomyces sp. TG1A-8 TaxID=3051385 RepID=UPI00265C5555|nr:class I adenylate-forming enzyme family protein [Streptomyces sp. TG1A-8]MDO0926689.1 class I adenylate-forming enzyme family protein [Streptomyces sp. TG1A-8]